jgi:hypothetical protein
MANGASRLLICVSTFLTVLALGPGVLSQQSKQAVAAPRAVVSVTSFDFGDIYRGEVISQVFVIRNAGDADLLINDFVPGCSCEVTDADRVIAPGKEGRAIIEVNTALQAGRLFKTATLKTNDPNVANINLTLTANVLTGPNGGPVENVTIRQGKHVGPVFVSPHTNWAIRTQPGHSARFEFLVSADKGDVSLEKVTTESTHLSAHIETVETGKRYKVVVESLATHQANSFDNTLIVHTNSPDLPWFPLHLAIRILPGE